MRSRPKTILIVPDAHHPYHDKRAWRCLLNAARVVKADCVLVLGDFADCYQVTSHPKNPMRLTRFADEIAAAALGLRELCDATKSATRRVFIEGNHEDRLNRYIHAKAPELCGYIPDIRAGLGIEEGGWEWVPYKSHVKIGSLFFTHDVGHAGKTALRQSQQAFGANVVIGHTHRLELLEFGNADGRPMVAASLGWLGDAKRASYMHRAKANREWAHGFGVARLGPNGSYHIEPVRIHNGTCVVGGKVVTWSKRQ